MIRERLQAALKDATDSGEQRAMATLRLILAALRERDHCARDVGAGEGLSDQEVREMLEDMVAQRRQEIIRCEACARVDRAEQEAEEIDIIQQFLPVKMSPGEIGGAVDAAIAHSSAGRSGRASTRSSASPRSVSGKSGRMSSTRMRRLGAYRSSKRRGSMRSRARSSSPIA